MLQVTAPPLVLASGSATRRALLQAAGLRFEAVAPDVDEAAIKRAQRAEGASPEAAALALATAKAHAVNAPDALVIGADQLLVCEDAWFDKPADLAAARHQLLRLRGRWHRLVTSVVCCRGGLTVWRHVATPKLEMRSFSERFLDAYLAAEAAHVTASVGAYRLEAAGMHLFTAVEGEHAAILGLPTLALLAFLREQAILAE
jgi:septum formation protein